MKTFSSKHKISGAALMLGYILTLIPSSSFAEECEYTGGYVFTPGCPANEDDYKADQGWELIHQIEREERAERRAHHRRRPKVKRVGQLSRVAPQSTFAHSRKTKNLLGNVKFDGVSIDKPSITAENAN